MDKIRSIQLSLLEYALDICKSNNLMVYAWGGTLLGAIRHKGFVPWDTNVDLSMPRADFNIFSSYMKEHIASDYVYEYIGIGSKSYKFYGKLSYRNSVCLYDSVDYSSYNGIALAVHPMDDADDDYKTLISDIISDKSLRRKILVNSKSAYFSSCEDVSDLVDEYNNRQLHKDKSSRYILYHRCGVYEKEIFDKSLFSDVNYMKFENIEVPVPSGYDSILTTMFGKYMSYRKTLSRHGFVKYVSADISWDEYKKNHPMPQGLPIDIDLPDSFFEPYVFSNGYKVTRYKRCMDAVMVDMLKKVIDLCDKLGIVYYLDGGSLLGAVRDNGIIPWDDDIDVVMFRDDYDRFREAFNKEYENSRYIFHDCDHKRRGRVLNTDTTHLPLYYKKNGVNCMFVDIFPLDSVPLDKDARNRMYRCKKYSKENAKELSDKYNDGNTVLFGSISTSTEKREFIRYYDDYTARTKLKFEGLDVDVPYDYEKCCEQQYGKNWREYVMGYSLHQSFENCYYIPYYKYFDFYPDIESLMHNIE